MGRTQNHHKTPTKPPTSLVATKSSEALFISCFTHFLQQKIRWWFQRFFIFTQILGKWSNSTNSFEKPLSPQTEWVKQLVKKIASGITWRFSSTLTNCIAKPQIDLQKYIVFSLFSFFWSPHRPYRAKDSVSSCGSFFSFRYWHTCCGFSYLYRGKGLSVYLADRAPPPQNPCPVCI